MFDQNLKLLQPGGRFSIIWQSGDPVKKKLPLKLRKMMVNSDLKTIISNLRPYVLNFQRDTKFNKNLAMPLNVAYRLVYGTLKCVEVILDDIKGQVKQLASLEIRFFQTKQNLEMSEQVSYMLLGDENMDGEMHENVLKKKRKRADGIFDVDDIEDLYHCHFGMDFGNLRIDEEPISPPTDVSHNSRYSTAIESLEKSREREKRKREFTELFDIISEVGKENGHLVEVAREAFSMNPLLSEVLEKKISGNTEGIEACYDLILDDKVAQTELYLQKLKLMDQNVISEKCIAEVSRRSGKPLSIRLDNVIPQDIYTELTSFVQGKNSLLNVASTFQVTREDIHEGMTTLAPDVTHEEPMFTTQIPEATLEETLLPPPVLDTENLHETAVLEESGGVTANQPQVEEEIVVAKPVKKKKIAVSPRVRQARQQVPNSLEVVVSMRTLEEIIQFFNRRKISPSPKIGQKIKKISKACENLVNDLVKRNGNSNVQECVEFDFWFKSLEDISEKVYNNNGCWLNMFDKLQALPFVHEDDGFIFKSQYDDELRKILCNLNISKVDYGLYGAVVDMPILGMSNNYSNREIIKRWLVMNELELPFSELSVQTSSRGKKYSLLPKCLPVYYRYSDFTHSLKTLYHPYNKLKYPFLSKISQDRGLYHRHTKLSFKKSRRFIQNDIGDWNFFENINVIEKMLKNVVLSDSVLCSKFHNLQSLDNMDVITKKNIKSFTYNPCGAIVWSDLTDFLDSLFKVYCEIEEDQDDSFSFIVDFLNELFESSERKPLYQESCKEVEYKSRINEINNVLKSEYRQIDNYFYNDSNDKIKSKFKRLLPVIVDDKTSVLDEVDMTVVLDGLEAFELELSLGYIPPDSVESVERPEEEPVFNKIKSSYEILKNNTQDLRTKHFGNTQFLIPNKWNDILTNYPINGRKRPNNESVALQGRPKRSRSSICLPEIPEENLPTECDMLENVPEILDMEKNPETESIVANKASSSNESCTFKTLQDVINNNSSQYSNSSVTFKKFGCGDIYPIEEETDKENLKPHEVSGLPSSPVLVGEQYETTVPHEVQETGWLDMTISPPQILQKEKTPENFEILQQPSMMQSVFIDEKRKEVEELMKRHDVVPEHQYLFAHNKHRFDKEANRLTDEDYLKFARHQLGPTDFCDVEEEVYSDYGSEPETSDLFKDIPLYNYTETTIETYEKIKLIAGDTKRTSFEELIKISPTRACVAKSFMNIAILGRNKKYIAVSQKHPKENIIIEIS